MGGDHDQDQDVLNETTYPTREVERIVHWVLRYLDVDAKRCYVKVKHHTGVHAYQGRFYPNAEDQGRTVWSGGWDGHWRDVGPVVPSGFDHLIVGRIGKPGTYPCMNRVYKRKDSPGRQQIETWQEALVAIMAHEAYHLRQHTTKAARNHGRYSEVDTEWAAHRLLAAWREEQQVKVKAA